MLKRKRLAEEDELEAVIRQMQTSRLEHKDSRLLCLPDDLLALILSFDSFGAIVTKHRVVCRHFFATIRSRFRQIVSTTILLTDKSHSIQEEEETVVNSIPEAIRFLVDKGARNLQTLRLRTTSCTLQDLPANGLFLLNPRKFVVSPSPPYEHQVWSVKDDSAQIVRAGPDLLELELNACASTRLLETLFVHSPNIKSMTVFLTDRADCRLTSRLLTLLPDLKSVTFPLWSFGQDGLNTHVLNELVQACAPRLESLETLFHPDVFRTGMHLLKLLTRLKHVVLHVIGVWSKRNDLDSLRNWTMLETVALYNWSSETPGAFSLLLGKAPIQQICLINCRMYKGLLVSILKHNKDTLRELKLTMSRLTHEEWTALFQVDMPKLEFITIWQSDFFEFLRNNPPTVHWPRLIGITLRVAHSQLQFDWMVLAQRMMPTWKVTHDVWNQLIFIERPT